MAHGWVLFLVSATRSPVPHCDVERAGLEHSLGLGWGALRRLHETQKLLKQTSVHPIGCRSMNKCSSQENICFSQPSWTSNQPRRLISSSSSSTTQNQRTRELNLWFSTLTPQDGFPTGYLPFSSESPLKGTGLYPTIFLPFLSNYMCIFLIAWL